MIINVDVLCVGGVVIDAFLGLHDANLSCSLDKKNSLLCVKYGEKIPVDTAQFLVGGNATNVSVGLSRLGLKSSLAAEIGSDEFARKIMNTLTTEQVDIHCLVQTPEKASSFSVAINFQGERTLFVEHVRRDHSFDLEKVQPQWVYLTSLGEDWIAPYDTVAGYIQKNNIKLAFNPGTQQIQAGIGQLEKLLQLTTILFVNKEEGESLIQNKEASMEDLLSQLQKMGPEIVVVTDGSRGSSAIGKDGTITTHGIKNGPCIEKTGAGDAYATGFLAATINGLSIQEAMGWGAENATSVIGIVGAQPGLLTKTAMEEKLAQRV